MFKGSKVERRLDDRSELKTILYRGVWPVADREFHVLSSWQPLRFRPRRASASPTNAPQLQPSTPPPPHPSSFPGLGAVVGTRSVRYSGRGPGHTGAVLGKVFAAGFLVRPLPEEQSATGTPCPRPFNRICKGIIDKLSSTVVLDL